MKEKKELLKPKIDVVFHSLFRQGNEDITKAVITAVTKEKIEKIDLNNDRYIIGKYPEEKLGILDLRATLNDGIICNIEVQLANNEYTAERFLYYWSRIYSGQLLKGSDYAKLNKVIGIIILDYNFEKLREIESMHTKWQIKETLTGQEIILTDLFELHIIEIPKAKKILEQDTTNELAQWMMFFNNPNEKEVEKIMEENKEIKRAMDELKELSQNEELRRIAELKEKAILDEKMARIGLTQAGKREGAKEAKIEIAKKLLKMNYSIEEIMNITELTSNEIISLKG